MSERLEGWRAEGASVGVVPTMGALHEGHLSLIRRSKVECDRTAATIYVNPLQFSPGEDFETYPRRARDDMMKLEDMGCDLIFMPTDADMYGVGFATTVEVRGLSEVLCGRTRPNFFRGVTTELCRLFNFLGKARVFLGEKDYQQYLVVRKMVHDLRLPVELAVCSTVRAEDGLALSSRNERLPEQQRTVAPALYRVLSSSAEALLQNFMAYGRILSEAEDELMRSGFSSVEYLELREEETLAPATARDGPNRLYAAVWLGEVRLVDNVPVIR
jgi:pantoate--beta-alanine ligase